MLDSQLVRKRPDDVYVVLDIGYRRKPQGKKNKTWDGDAYISLAKDKLIMISEDGKM